MKKLFLPLATRTQIQTTPLPLPADPKDEPMKEKYFPIVLLLTCCYILELTLALILPLLCHRLLQLQSSTVPWICYLKGKLCVSFLPNWTFNLGCSINSDFHRLFGRKQQENAISAKSRTGMMMFSGSFLSSLIHGRPKYPCVTVTLGICCTMADSCASRITKLCVFDTPSRILPTLQFP